MFARFDWVYRRNSFRAFVISIKTYWRVTPPMKREIRFIHTYLYVYSGLTKEKSSKRNEFGSSSDRVWVGFVSGLSQVWVEFRSGLGQVHTYFLDVNPLWTHVYLYTFFPSIPSTQVSRFPFRLPTYYLISWFTIHIRKLINNCLIRPASNLLIMKSN